MLFGGGGVDRDLEEYAPHPESGHGGMLRPSPSSGGLCCAGELPVTVVERAGVGTGTGGGGSHGVVIYSQPRFPVESGSRSQVLAPLPGVIPSQGRPPPRAEHGLLHLLGGGTPPQPPQMRR